MILSSTLPITPKWSSPPKVLSSRTSTRTTKSPVGPSARLWPAHFVRLPPTPTRPSSINGSSTSWNIAKRSWSLFAMPARIWNLVRQCRWTCQGWVIWKPQGLLEPLRRTPFDDYHDPVSDATPTLAPTSSWLVTHENLTTGLYSRSSGTSAIRPTSIYRPLFLHHMYLFLTMLGRRSGQRVRQVHLCLLVFIASHLIPFNDHIIFSFLLHSSNQMTVLDPSVLHRTGYAHKQLSIQPPVSSSRASWS